MNTSHQADVQLPSREQRQADVVAALCEVLPRSTILIRHEDTAPYECDALTAYRISPMVVVLPETEAQVAAVLQVCHRMGVPSLRAGRARVCPAAPRRTIGASFSRSPSSTRS